MKLGQLISKDLVLQTISDKVHDQKLENQA